MQLSILLLVHPPMLRAKPSTLTELYLENRIELWA